MIIVKRIMAIPKSPPGMMLYSNINALKIGWTIRVSNMKNSASYFYLVYHW
jgi:hypothetical protein